jgi:cytochrome c-type biogenesis protein
MDPSIGAAFLAGILMFLAPCTLPIVPGYLAFIAGGGTSKNEQHKKGRLVLNAIAFVIGFSVVFILLGLFAGVIGHILGPWRETLGRAAGVLIILFGLTMLGVLRLPILGGEHHIKLPKFLTIGRWESSILIGALFALGWSPCIGPVLGSVLFIASASATALKGAVLLGFFSLGLGLPFIVSAIFMEQVSTWFSRSGKLAQIFSVIGGLLLVGIGTLMALGDLGLLVTWGFGIFDFAGYQGLLEHL